MYRHSLDDTSTSVRWTLPPRRYRHNTVAVDAAPEVHKTSPNTATSSPRSVRARSMYRARGSGRAACAQGSPHPTRECPTRGAPSVPGDRERQKGDRAPPGTRPCPQQDPPWLRAPRKPGHDRSGPKASAAVARTCGPRDRGSLLFDGGTELEPAVERPATAGVGNVSGYWGRVDVELDTEVSQVSHRRESRCPRHRSRP
jgi:hypothetical protein